MNFSWYCLKHCCRTEYFLVYDSGTPHSEYAQEKLIFINDQMVDSKIRSYGPPPQDIDQQIAWYRDTLRDSVRVAAMTNAPRLQNETSFAAHGSEFVPQNLCSNPSNGLPFSLEGTSSSPLQLVDSSNGIPTIDTSSTNYLTNIQHRHAPAVGPPIETPDLGLDYWPPVDHSMFPGPNENLYSTDLDFEASGSASVNNLFQTNWQDQSGRN